jgi:hypothetical protein
MGGLRHRYCGYSSHFVIFILSGPQIAVNEIGYTEPALFLPGAISVKGNQVPPRLFFVLSRGVLLLSRALPPRDRRKAPDPKYCLFIYVGLHALPPNPCSRDLKVD